MKNTRRQLLVCALFFLTCACVYASAAPAYVLYETVAHAGYYQPDHDEDAASASDSIHEVGDSLTVYFRQGISTFEPAFRHNGKRCEEFIARIERLREKDASLISKVQMYSSASPEGTVQLNEKLAMDRANSVLRYLHDVLDFADSIVFVQPIAEDWETLAVLAEADPAVPSKEKAMEIILDGSNPTRKEDLRALDGGRAWDYLYKNYFPQLRSFRVYVYVRPADSHLHLQTRVGGIDQPFALLTRPAAPKPADPEWTRQITLKTNMLGWALIGENIAVEVDLCQHLSLAVPFYYSGGLDYFKETLKFRGIVLQPEVRWYPWLSKEKKNDGFFVGAHFGLGWYNYALDGDWRIQDHNGDTPSYGGGLSLGYALQFKKNPRWGMEFGIGGGVYKSTYDIFFNEHNGPFYDQAIEKLWYGVDNASVSFTYKFDVKKGGQR